LEQKRVLIYLFVLLQLLALQDLIPKVCMAKGKKAAQCIALIILLWTSWPASAFSGIIMDFFPILIVLTTLHHRKVKGPYLSPILFEMRTIFRQSPTEIDIVILPFDQPKEPQSVRSDGLGRDRKSV